MLIIKKKKNIIVGIFVYFKFYIIIGTKLLSIYQLINYIVVYKMKLLFSNDYKM